MNNQIKQYPNKPIYKQIVEYRDYCIEYKGATEQTMHGKNWVLENFAKNIPVDDLQKVTEKHINDWLQQQVDRGCSGRTANGRFHVIRPMINYYRDMGLTIPVKLRLVKRQFEAKPRRVHYLEDQIKEALKYASPMEWLLIKLAFDAGLRLSELTNLRLREIDDRQINYIGKGRKERESYMSPETRERLNDYLAKNKITDYLWANPYSPTGAPYSTTTIRNIMRRPFRYAGLNDFYPHALRHSFATDAQRHNAGMLELRDMLGHSNAETTQRYLHGLEGHLQNIFDQYKFGIVETPTVVKPTKKSTKDMEDGAVNFMRRLAEEFATVA